MVRAMTDIMVTSYAVTLNGLRCDFNLDPPIFTTIKELRDDAKADGMVLIEVNGKRVKR